MQAFVSVVLREELQRGHVVDGDAEETLDLARVQVHRHDAVGAGGITVNYPHEPGKPKGRTKIGRNVRTGVQNAFVAPREIGDDAWIAVGSVITDDVPPGSLAGFAPRQVTKEGYVYDKHGRPADD